MGEEFLLLPVIYVTVYILLEVDRKEALELFGPVLRLGEKPAVPRASTEMFTSSAMPASMNVTTIPSLLADNGSTRLYFAPNADYNGTSSAALTAAGLAGAASGGTTALMAVLYTQHGAFVSPCPDKGPGDGHAKVTSDTRRARDQETRGEGEDGGRISPVPS